ncbi:MAG: TRAP transporter large permease [Planctomycetaceae bacterium]|nr:TRAP transporter large permease [Planctomycetaceae bacterium]
MTLDPGLLPLTFLVLVLFACLTVPLAAALFFSGALLLLLNPDPLPAEFAMDFSLAMRLNSPALISIPLFALAGELAVAAGITDRLLDLADAVCGRGRFAAGVRSVLGCTAFATVSGVGPAAVSAEAKRLTPALVRAGYGKDIAAGLIACAATLAIIIPASIPLTVYAATTGIQTNIVFAASFVPGLLTAALLVAAIALYARLHDIRPSFRPEPLRRLGVVVYHARWAVAMPVLVLGALFTGFLTAPEAAAFASGYAYLVGRYAYRSLTAGTAWEILARAATGAATVLLMAGMGGLFVMLMASCGFTDRLAETVFWLAGGRTGSIFAINIILLVAGCFLNMPGIITVIAPLLLPLAAMCRLSVPHFGVIVVLNLAIGLVTPPQAWNVTAAAKTIGIDMWQASRGASLFMVAMVAALACVSYLPELSLWLPRLFGWPV